MSATTISLEGRDSLGKSTQIDLLRAKLESAGKRVKVIKLPSAGLFGRLCYKFLRNGWARKVPNLFQLFQFLDKLSFQLLTWQELDAEFDYLLFDRWHASMWAYGPADGASEWFTDALVSCLREPHLTLVLVGKPHPRPGKQDSYESDTQFQRDVATRYILWAGTHGSNTRVIDANASLKQVEDRVRNHVMSIV